MRLIAIQASLWLTAAIAFQFALGVNYGAIVFSAIAALFYVAVFWLCSKMFAFKFWGLAGSAAAVASGLLVFFQAAGAKGTKFSATTANVASWVDGNITAQGVWDLFISLLLFNAWIFATLWILRRLTGSMLEK